jgi:hypothetical protein
MIYGGHMVAANAAGLAVPASAVAAQVTLGVSDEYADNTAGAAAATSVMVRRGKAWKLANLSGDAVTQADVGKTCYVADSITVAKTSNTNARPVAGQLLPSSPTASGLKFKEKAVIVNKQNLKTIFIGLKKTFRMRLIRPPTTGSRLPWSCRPPPKKRTTPGCRAFRKCVSGLAKRW